MGGTGQKEEHACQRVLGAAERWFQGRELYLGWFLRRWYLSHTEESEGVDHTTLGEGLSGLNVEQMRVSQGGRGRGFRDSQGAAWQAQ